MADHEPALLDIQVDADDYASTAAGDVPSTVPRTHQSEADFQAQRALYQAKTEGESNYDRLLNAVPILSAKIHVDDTAEADDSARTKLSKKDVQLLGYAAGELYYQGRYDELLRLCQRIHKRCVGDVKLQETLERWMQRCEEKKKGRRE